MPDFATAPTPAKSKAGDQAARQELAPVDAALRQLPARRFLQEVFLFVASTHL